MADTYIIPPKSQEEIVLDLFNFHKMVVTNLGYPVYKVEIHNSLELERLGIRLKKRQNLCISVYLTINGVAIDNCYFVVDPIDKNCYSYCLFGDSSYNNRVDLYNLGIDVYYWLRKFGYSLSYNLTLTDIFSKLLPSSKTHWEHMRHIIGCDIDWENGLFERKEKSLNILEQAEKYIRLTTDNFKTTI
jgi:hypothetical protein